MANCAILDSSGYAGIKTRKKWLRKRREMMKKVRLEGHIIELSNTNKVFFSGEGITKGDLIDYYQRIAEVMLPYLIGRPVTMHRFPDGINGGGFYQQEVSDYFPGWIERVSVKKEGGSITHIVCQNKATLVYLANQACITPHVWLSREDRLNYPDLLLFDLDPPEDNFAPVRQAAFFLRDLLQELGLESFLKTTGSRGLHIIIPLDRSAVFDKVRAFAQDVAHLLVKWHPEKITDEQRKEKRGNRVFIDTLRNSYGQTAVAPYAVRAKAGAPVAAPIDWDEVAEPNLNSRSYNIKNIFHRLSSKKDPWGGMWHKPYSLEKVGQRLHHLKQGI
jgi:bifunctional non-homologous end joining protein LigD